MPPRSPASAPPPRPPRRPRRSPVPTPAASPSSARASRHCDMPLVRRARFFADHKEGVLRQGAELLVAIAVGAVGEDHLLGEIGEVFAGTLAGRTAAGDVTIYKSLGSIVQDLAAGWYLVERA